MVQARVDVDSTVGSSADVPARLHICVLGPLQVEVDGTRRDLRRPAERLLLGMLAAAPGEYIDAAELVEAGWPEAEPIAGRRTLATTIWRLRRTLEPASAAVVGRGAPAGYALDPGRTTFAADTFDTDRARGRERLLADDLDGAIEALTAALGRWRGEPLADLGDHPRIRAQRVRLQELRHGALEDLATALSRAGRPQDALVHLERLLDDEPLREQAWALRIGALVDLGQHDRAARMVDEARRHLAEIGLEPGLALRRAATRIRDRLDAPPLATATPSTLPNLPGPFVGRDHELDRLLQLVSGPGDSRLALVLGPAGTGKTRLAVEVAAHAGRPVRYLSLTRGGRDPLGGIAQMVRTVVGDSMLGDDLPAGVARILDPAASALHIDDLDAAEARHTLVDTVAQLVAEAAGSAGMVLVVDDAHASSAAMLALLHHLATGGVAAPVTVLALVRTPVPSTAPLAEAEHVAATVVTLTGLGHDEVGALSAALLPAALDADHLRWVEHQTGGNPLFVAVLLADPTVRAALAAGATPPRRSGIDQAVAGFLAPYTGTTRDVLRAAAVLGRRTFDLGLLADVVGASADPDQLGSAVDAARGGGVLLDDAGGLDVYAFAHGLIRDVLAAEVPTAERHRWHRACALALERRLASDPTLLHEVADHHARAWPATPAADAARWLVTSANALSQATEHDAAVERLAAATDLLGRDAQAPVRSVVHAHLALAAARIDLGDLDGSVAATQTAARLAREAGWADGVAMAAARAADTGVATRTDHQAVEELLLEAAALVDEIDARLAGLVVAALSRRRPVAADRLADRARDRCVRDGSGKQLARLQNELWDVAIGPEAVAVAEEVASIGASIGSARLEAGGLIKAWISRLSLGEATFHDPVAERIGRLVDEAMEPTLDWTWLTWLAARSIATGYFDEAEALLARTLRLPLHLQRERLGRPTGRLLSTQATQRVWMAFLRNDADALRTAMRTAPGSWTQNEVDQRWLMLVRHGGDRRASQDVLDDLTAAARTMVRPTRSRLLTAVLLGDEAAPFGHRPGIEFARSVMNEHAGEQIVNHDVYLGAVDQHLGWIDLYTEQFDDAVVRLDRALAQVEAAGSRPYAVRVRRTLAAALRGRGGAGDADRATALESEAMVLAAEIGALPGVYRPRLATDPAADPGDHTAV